MAALRAPERSGSREQARTLLDDLPESLVDALVEIDCANVFVATPSFMDEVVKILLVERNAAVLRLTAAPERTTQHAIRAATNRGVATRLEITPSGATSDAPCALPEDQASDLLGGA